MFAPIDDKVRSFLKGLYTSDVYGYEDPTYLGFSLHFDFDPVFRDIQSGQTMDPLFAEPGQGINSAQEYLQNIGFPQRAKMIKEFKEMLRFMNANAPYYFQEVGGVAELWKIEKKPFDFETNRGFDKKLKFKCMESIDLRMTAWADLYRQASFDNVHMRELLPENLRWFTMSLRIAEIRKFHKLKQVIEDNAGGQAIDAAPNGDILEVVNDLISVVEFKLSHCQFDFEDSFMDEFSNAEPEEQAKHQFTIEVGTIHQKSTYKLLDIALTDHFAVGDNRIVEHSDVIGGKFAGGSNNASNDRSVLDDVPLGSRVPGYDNAVNPNNLFNGAISALQGQAQSLGNQLEGLGGQLIGGALNNLQSQITGAALGNVYGIRNRSLLETINGFIRGDENQIQPPGTYDVYPDNGTDTKTATDLGNAHTNNGANTPSLQQTLAGDLGNVYE